MSSIADKNRASWDAYSDQYMRYELTDDKLSRIVKQPESAFAPETWALISQAFPSLEGMKICVPSSGNNHAVFAFAAMGAQVTSCDISSKQLEHAALAAAQLGLSIEFKRADTMALSGIASGVYDFVYTSNGVHVWIDDLPAMYQNIARVLKPGGYYSLYEIHPYQRPFDGDCLTALKVIKPYDLTGPFERGNDVTFGWRLMDILNAMLSVGLSLRRIEELQPTVNYEEPDWIPIESLVGEQGHRLSKEEVERLYDWRSNPQAALPNMFTLLARKA